MRLYVGITDKKWYERLLALRPDEANFWLPGEKSTFKALAPGEPFLFKLHSPDHYVVGGGFFLRFCRLPISLAWEAFGEKNGVTDLVEFRKRVQKYRSGVTAGANPEVGCVLLASPFFFPESGWIEPPKDWRMRTQQGKGYDARDPAVKHLWDAVQAQLALHDARMVAENRRHYGTAYLATARLGQGSFRVLVTEAYERRCAITGERALPVLQAAHIKPFAQSGPSVVSNGLLLRADAHILFDKGYVTVTPGGRVEVSRRIKEDYDNGEHYYAYHGKHLTALPGEVELRPSPAYLRWHNDNVFLG